MTKEMFFNLLYGTLQLVFVTASRPCEDVTIIGAGIGGTYAGWRLRNEGLRIGIYEFSNRVGGRMYTRTFSEASDIPIDLGAMIFVPQLHPRMNKSAYELGLKLIPVDLDIIRDENKLLFLRDTHLRPFEIDGSKLPYRLSEEERPSELTRRLSEKYTDYNGTDNYNILAERYTAVTIQDGEPVYKQSYLEVVQKIGLSKEAYNFIVDSAPFRFGYRHESATENFLTGRNSTTTSTQFGSDDSNVNKNPEPDVFTADKGMDAYPKSLLRHFLLASPNRHTLHKNRQLVGISKVPYGNGRFELYFNVTRTHKGVTKPTSTQESVCSKKVILAIPKQPLQQITFPVQNFPQFQQYVDSVIDVQASKVYLLYDNPWWRQIPLNFTHTRSDLPYHQSYDWGVSKNGKAVLLASVTDDNVPYWRHLQNKGTIISVHDDETRVTNEVVKHVHLQLSKVYNISVNSIPNAVDGIMFIVDSYPFNGGWSYPKPGFNGIEVKRYLTKPFTDLDIFVAHGYYGLLYKYWAESSLEAADEVLLNFGIEPLSPIIGL